MCKQLKNMVLGFVFILRELTETCMFVFLGLRIFSTNCHIMTVANCLVSTGSSMLTFIALPH